MVREVRGMGMEVCTTLGMLSPEQARQLKEACVFEHPYPHLPFADGLCRGLTAYNHNLDTSREFYPKVRAMLMLKDVNEYHA